MQLVDQVFVLANIIDGHFIPVEKSRRAAGFAALEFRIDDATPFVSVIEQAVGGAIARGGRFTWIVAGALELVERFVGGSDGFASDLAQRAAGAGHVAFDL